MDLKKHSRRLTQLIAAVLYNCNITGFAKGSIYKGRLKTACVPGLNCYSCPGAVGSCPIGSLQSALVSSKNRFPYYILGVLILFGVLLGRFICGFLCPFGLIQELLYKIPSAKIRKSRITRILSHLKYAVLLAIVIIIPIVIGIPSFCKYLCPAGTLEGGVVLGIINSFVREMLGSLFVWKCIVLFIVIISAVFCFRSFCRFLCPLGAFYSLFNRFSVMRMIVNENKCTHCGACVKHCRMDICKVGDRECIQCGECQAVCRSCAVERRTLMENDQKETDL